jgi:hypothetical protein
MKEGVVSVLGAGRHGETWIVVERDTLSTITAEAVQRGQLTLRRDPENRTASSGATRVIGKVPSDPPSKACMR